ncbi:MAG: Mur ligase family protein, partial [Cellulomonadaceae bacterium]
MIERTLPRNRRETSIGKIAQSLGLTCVGDPEVEVSSAAEDNRHVIPGDLFVALPGAHVHGASFAHAAVGAGARAVLTDADGARFLALQSPEVPVLVAEDPRAVAGPVAALVYAEPSRRLTAFAVTGTNGKTTTTFLLDHVLRACGLRTGLIGTVESRFGDRVVPSRLTTPEAAELQEWLAAMVEDGVDALAMEVSSHSLSMHRVDGVVFDVAGFTNLSQDHLDF